jgi:hypothetical protein
MAETEHITVANVSDGPCRSGSVGDEVSLPVVEILTGRGFVTGKSGSGKSNSASVVAEKLLDNGFGLLIVDIDGEYYGLKEEYEILHAGGDEECDIQVTTDHSEKLASLALEQNVPIILDMSSYLDESEAQELLTAVARSLFAKAKKQKQPFLLLVEEVHEYIPEKGSVGECGKMLIKIGKRGRKHGLGICGISQRPADVKKDFITQCDWLLWHRLTWNNDTKVVRRILDSEYADAVESLDDGEGFLMTDWAESVERVQFHRKQTFDAGATPGLDDFERPDLKSVSSDLVSELEQISDEEAAREDRVAELREQLDRKNSRIAELETELQDARDMSRMADQFVDALVRHVEGPAPGRTEQERMHRNPSEVSMTGANGAGPAASPNGDISAGSGGNGTETVTPSESAGPTPGDRPGANEQMVEAMDEASEADVFDAVVDVAEETDDTVQSDPTGDVDDAPESDPTGDVDDAPETQFSAEEILEELKSVSDISVEAVREESSTAKTPREEIEAQIRSDAEILPDEGSSSGTEPQSDELSTEDDESDGAEILTDAGPESEFDAFDVEASVTEAGASAPETGDQDSVENDGCDDEPTVDIDEEPLAVRELKADIGAMETKTRKMLAFYREFGPGTPLNAHFAAGGDGDRTSAYAHNRTLRTHGLVEHVGRGNYDYCLRELLTEELDRSVDERTIDAYATDIEQTHDL